MIILRVVAAGIAEHFPARRSEWVMAAMMMGWGALVLRPSDIFEQSPAWQPLAAWASEPVWGTAALLIGALRLCALIINGTFYQSWYGRWSPHVRALASFLSCFIWMQLSWGLLNAPIVSTGLSIYPGLLVLDLMNVAAAASDAGKMDRAQKHGP